MSQPQIKCLKGKQIGNYISELANLRITIFKEYPYLYDGNLDYEINYLQTYLKSKESILVIVFDDSKVIGASTAIPLVFETPECQQPFIDHQLDVTKIFYLGESLLLPEYRGKGIYRHFFQEREAAALKYGSTITSFCGVARAENDSRRPTDYISLEKVWRHFGYQQHPELCAYYTWKEINQNEATSKPMIFWMKHL